MCLLHNVTDMKNQAKFGKANIIKKCFDITLELLYREA